jgi:hypothetical protein
MPPLPAAPKVVRCALSGTTPNGNAWLTRFFIQYTGTAPTNAQLATFNASIATAYTADLKAHIDASTLTQIETIDLSSSTSAVAITAESITGSSGGANLPDDLCMVISYEIGRRYRGGHPRGYWRFGDGGQYGDSGHWSAGFITTTNTAFNAFFTALFAAGWTGAGTLTQVNVSYYSGFTVVTNPITHRARNVPTLRVAPTVDTVTSIVARSSFGSQRRRTAFVG